jgi:hypothetical protein
MKQVCDESRNTREVLSSISALPAKVDAMEDSLVGKIEVRKALEAGNVTPHNLSVAVQQCFTNLRADLRAELQPLLGDRGIPSDGVRSHPPPGSMATGEPTAYADAAVHTFPTHQYEWADTPRSLPQDFRFPRADLLTGWFLWWHGHRKGNIPAYRELAPQDCSHRNTRKRLSGWKYVFHRLECNLPSLPDHTPSLNQPAHGTLQAGHPQPPSAARESLRTPLGHCKHSHRVQDFTRRGQRSRLSSRCVGWSKTSHPLR